MLIQYNMLVATCDLELVALIHYRCCFKIQTPRYHNGTHLSVAKRLLCLLFLALDCMVLEGMGWILLKSWWVANTWCESKCILKWISDASWGYFLTFLQPFDAILLWLPFFSFLILLWLPTREPSEWREAFQLKINEWINDGGLWRTVLPHLWNTVGGCCNQNVTSLVKDTRTHLAKDVSSCTILPHAVCGSILP